MRAEASRTQAAASLMLRRGRCVEAGPSRDLRPSTALDSNDMRRWSEASCDQLAREGILEAPLVLHRDSRCIISMSRT